MISPWFVLSSQSLATFHLLPHKLILFLKDFDFIPPSRELLFKQGGLLELFVHQGRLPRQEAQDRRRQQGKPPHPGTCENVLPHVLNP